MNCFSKESFSSEDVLITTEKIRRARLDKSKIVIQNWVALPTAETTNGVLSDVNNYAVPPVYQDWYS